MFPVVSKDIRLLGSRVHSLSDALSKVISEEFSEPVAPLERVQWRPVALWERGDISSDFMFRIARSLRKDPIPLAAKVADRLDAAVPDWKVWSERGFINCYPLAFHFCEDATPRNASTAGVTDEGDSCAIVVPPPLREESSWSYLRMVAGALVQAHCLQLLGCRIELLVGRCHIVLGPLAPLDATTIRATLQSALTAPSGSLRDAFGVVAPLLKPNVRTYLWLTPGGVSLKEMLSLALPQGGTLPSLQIISPNGGWFVAPPENSFDGNGACAVDTALWPLLLHLAGPVTARDLDPYIGRFKEFDNLVWSAGALRERIAHVFTLNQQRESLVIQNSVRCSLLRGAWLMGPRLEDAAYFGSVREFVAGVMDLLASAHATLLAPGQVPEMQEALRWRAILSAIEDFCAWFSIENCSAL